MSKGERPFRSIPGKASELRERIRKTYLRQNRPLGSWALVERVYAAAVATKVK